MSGGYRRIWASPVAAIVLLASSLVAPAGASSLTPQALDSPFKPAQATYFVAPTGDDSTGTGSQQAPFATVNRARQAVRQLIANGMTNDVVVMLRGGTYYQTSTTTFDENDSGRDGYQVVYTNYPGERPVLVGGQQVVNWTLDTGNIYRANVGASSDINHVMESGSPAVAARYPDTGYLRTDGQAANPRRAFNDAVLLSAPNDSFGFRGARAYVWAQEDWFSNTLPVASVATSGTTVMVNLAADTLQDITTGSRYYLQNVHAYLNQPGEFYYDKAAGTLYYWPRNTAALAEGIVVPRLDNVLRVKGSSSADYAHDIVIQGLTITGTRFPTTFSEIDTTWNNPADVNRQGLVSLQNARNVTVRGNRLLDAGLNAVALDYYSEANTIADNYIYRAGYHGVLLTGLDCQVTPSGPQPYDNKKNAVTNNQIYEVGQRVGHGSGVFLYQSGDNDISYNTIRGAPRYGIGAKGIRWGLMDVPEYCHREVSVSPPTFAAHWDYLTVRNNKFRWNDISRVLTDSEDAGGVSFWGAGTGNQVEGNRVHDLAAPGNTGGKAHGIYLDDSTDYTTVTKNVVYGIGGNQVGPINPKGIYNTISNNIFVGEAASDYMVRFRQNVAAERVDSHVYRNNIYYNKVGDTYYFFAFDDYNSSRIAESDSNVFYSVNGGYTMYGIEGADTYAQWQELGYDLNSVQQDPLFVDPVNDDYTLQPGSPAIAQGFDPFDQSAAGARAAYSDTYDTNVGAAPCGYTVMAGGTDTATVVSAPAGGTGKALRLVDNDTGTSGPTAGRRLTPQQSGSVSFETRVRAAQTGGALYLELRDGNGAAGVRVGLSSVGTIRRWTSTSVVDLQAYSADTWYTIRIDADVLTRKYDLFVDGHEVAHQVSFTSNVASIESLVVAAGTSTGTYYTDSATFAGARLIETATHDADQLGAAPCGYLLTSPGGVTVQQITGATGNALRLIDGDASSVGPSATRPLPPQSGRVSYETRVRAVQTDAALYLELRDSSGTAALRVGLAADGKVRNWINGGSASAAVQGYAPATWYTIRVVADFATGTYDLYVDGVLKVSRSPFIASTGNLGAFTMQAATGDGTFYADYTTLTVD